MKISVAPVPYFWSKEEYYRFYQQLCETDVDIVYLGETVCSKRRSMKLADWTEIAKQVKAAGKQAVLSSLTLIEATSEIKYLNQIVKQDSFLIEANDLAAVQICKTHHREFVCGPSINLYNSHSLELMVSSGMVRWVVPVELGAEAISAVNEFVKSKNIEIEYQGFGRMALAHSARCFTARHLGLSKDNCQFKCADFEQGFAANTQEGAAFIQVNGIQSQSSKLMNLLPYWPQMMQAGVDIFRVTPTSPRDTLQVIQLLSKSFEYQKPLCKDGLDFDESYQFCNGYWFQIEGMNTVI